MLAILLEQILMRDFELIIIIFLLVYILYLQLRLAKKNHLIESYIERLQRKEEEWTRAGNPLFDLGYNKKVVKDQFLNDEIYNFLFADNKDVKLYLHYTRTKVVANDILNDGFKFVNSFYKTAELVFNDKLYLMHRHNEHKQFGEFVIVLSISKKNFNYFTQNLSKLQAKNIAVEQILTEVLPQIDENGEEIFTSPKQFIKGYFNYITGSIVTNPYYNPDYLSPKFEENLSDLKK